MSFECVADLASVPVGRAVAVEVAGEPVALVRPSVETVRAVHNICSHQHYELAPEGIIDADSIECALHGSTFDLDTGEAQTLPAVDPIPVYGCEVRDGQVCVDVARQYNEAVPRY